ncbi:hypothetical protein P280DRAFT_160508 [Massarina eburnea CBS 473.64]|uniref:SWI5-dependent HO expression protein 3 n=1 Tax=Massarina eburnea CBS 473.64 TaxID=1395130 RepID=A0A6A6RQ87_9PLEO|nr:hypothetical protein P280DRAFT_160508 [Massarina eburnea CBS 473.64]
MSNTRFLDMIRRRAAALRPTKGSARPTSSVSAPVLPALYFDTNSTAINPPGSTEATQRQRPTIATTVTTNINPLGLAENTRQHEAAGTTVDSTIIGVPESTESTQQRDAAGTTAIKTTKTIRSTEMALLTSPRNANGPLPVDSPVMSPEHTPAPPAWTASTNNSAQSKTSQYIDKITSENEKLKRELTAEKFAREDDIKRVAAARTLAEETRAEQQRLQVDSDANKRTLERKDRKMKELEERLEAEVIRRKQAEQRAEDALKVLGDTQSDTSRKVALAHEQRLMAETNLNSAKEGYERLKIGYERRATYVTSQLNNLIQQQEEHEAIIQGYSTVKDAIEVVGPRNATNEAELRDVLGRYKEEHQRQVEGWEKEVANLRAMCEEKDARHKQLETEMKAARDKVGWIIAQQQRLNPN